MPATTEAPTIIDPTEHSVLAMRLAYQELILIAGRLERTLANLDFGFEIAAPLTVDESDLEDWYASLDALVDERRDELLPAVREAIIRVLMGELGE
jgi:hypothetical protein